MIPQARVGLGETGFKRPRPNSVLAAIPNACHRNRINHVAVNRAPSLRNRLLSRQFHNYGHLFCHDSVRDSRTVGAPLVGALGGHKARPYSANDALTTYTAVHIRYRICATGH